MEHWRKSFNQKMLIYGAILVLLAGVGVVELAHFYATFRPSTLSFPMLVATGGVVVAIVVCAWTAITCWGISRASKKHRDRMKLLDEARELRELSQRSRPPTA